MTINVGLIFSVGDTTPWFTIIIEVRHLELLTLIIFSVINYCVGIQGYLKVPPQCQTPMS